MPGLILVNPASGKDQARPPSSRSRLGTRNHFARVSVPELDGAVSAAAGGHRRERIDTPLFDESVPDALTVLLPPSGGSEDG